jgi:hypothetical protein
MKARKFVWLVSVAVLAGLVFLGQGGIGAPPSAIHCEFGFKFTDEAPALYMTSVNAATHRHAPTTRTLLFTFICFSSLNWKQRSVDNPARWSKHAPRTGHTDRFL